MIQHTPGPWESHVVTPGHPDNAQNLIVGAKDNYICRIFSDRATLAGLTSRAPTQETAHANARLISAAPDMAAVLQQVVTHFANTDAPLGVAARAALKKAGVA